MTDESDLATVVAVLAEHADRVDRTAAFPTESLDVLRRKGFMGFLVPVEYGGMGGSLAELATTARRLSAGCLSTALIWAMHCQQVDAIVRHGSDRLRESTLPMIAAGECYLASVTTDRGTGGALLDAESALGADESGILIDRDAPVVTGGAHADAFLLTARTGSDAASSETSLVYAAKAQLRTEQTGGWDSLGMRGTASVAMKLSGRVPRWAVLGRDGEFRAVATDSMIPLGHIGWAACWSGAAHHAFATVLRGIRDKEPWLRVDLNSDLTRERIGRIRVDLELVDAYLERTCATVAAARSAGHSLDRPATQIQLNTLKLAASELCFRAVDRLVQLVGLSVGYLKNAPVPLERVFRDLRSASLNYANDRLWPTVGLHSVLAPGD